MKLNLDKIKHILFDKHVSAYSIEAETGVSRHTIAKIRRGDADWKNLSAKTLIAIQKIIDDGRYLFINHDVKELREEVLDDMALFGEDYPVIVIFADEDIFEGCVVTYYDLLPPEITPFLYDEDREEYEETVKEWQRNIKDCLGKQNQVMTLQELSQKLEYQNQI